MMCFNGSYLQNYLLANRLSYTVMSQKKKERKKEKRKKEKERRKMVHSLVL